MSTIPTSTRDEIGLVDGAQTAGTREFTVVLHDDAVVQLDDLLVTAHTEPDGEVVTHYAIVTEVTAQIEGATYASDTGRITAERTMPGIATRSAAVQTLRVVPERWVAPQPGATVRRCTAERDRRAALFMDEMRAPLNLGIDNTGLPVPIDFDYLNGTKGGHCNIAGISGVATKTSFALHLLYMLLEQAQGKTLLGQQSVATRALVFNAKGEDLLHIDRPNATFDPGKDEHGGRYRALGVEHPGPFTQVALFAPRAPATGDTSAVPDVTSRTDGKVTAYGWTPWEFIREGMLRFCFTDPRDAGAQLHWVEQRVRTQLAKHAYPARGEGGSVVMADPPPRCGSTFEAILTQRRPEMDPGDGTHLRTFTDLVAYITEQLEDDLDAGGGTWQGRAQSGTVEAFLRRLHSLGPTIGRLVGRHLTRVGLDGPAVTVVDISTLHETAQRFVVGALLDEIWQSKQGSGREPLRFVLLDELNKYAPKDARSPIKELLVDIAERGRSLGVILIGAQQAASAVDPAIIRNAAIKVVGRIDASEAAQYRFLPAEMRDRATRFLPGTMVMDQPLVPAPIPIRFPFPAYATNSGDAAHADPAAVAAKRASVFDAVSRIDG